MSEKRDISLEDVRTLRAMHAQQTRRFCAIQTADDPAAVLQEVIMAHQTIPDLFDIIEYLLTRKDLDA